MSRFPGKRLPPHWVYIPSRREIRDLLRTLNADYRRVEFGGTGSCPNSVSLLLGYVQTHVVDGAWRFYLRLWGVPEAVVNNYRDELAHAALDAIGRSTKDCLASRPTDVSKSTQTLLRFGIQADGIVCKCSTRPIDQYSFSAGRWWEDERRSDDA
ncbi:MAG: hypothetical protein LLG00_17360 [Planctomycetaceae bacterium]|nr:hypothetical protein [Planctomycetaceae bacterium]